MATVLFDDALMTAWKRLDFALFLELEELFKYNGKPLVQATRMQDDAGRSIWAVNVMLKNAKGRQAGGNFAPLTALQVIFNSRRAYFNGSN